MAKRASSRSISRPNPAPATDLRGTGPRPNGEGIMSTSTSLTRWEPVAHAVLRIVAGLIFLEHGTQKFLGFPAGDMAGAGRAFDNMGAYAGVVESAAGLLIALGLFSPRSAEQTLNSRH